MKQNIMSNSNPTSDIERLKEAVKEALLNSRYPVSYQEAKSILKLIDAEVDFLFNNRIYVFRSDPNK